MTISQSPSAPLIAVVGVTGKQGGSVIKALEESEKPYRIRSFTRDATKPAAQDLIKRGGQIVVVSLTVDNKENVYQAFKGTNAAFEIADGKLMIDAAKAGGATRIIWSGASSFTEISDGKYTNAGHFEGKAAISAYLRESGVPFVDVQAGVYASNFVDDPNMRPTKNADGSLTLNLAMSPTTVVPLIDAAHDYGLFVRRALEAAVFPDGTTVYTSGEDIAIGDAVAQLSQVIGKKINYNHITIEAFEQGLKAAGLPPHIVMDFKDMMLALSDVGYYGPNASSTHEELARKPRTWLEFAKNTDWSKIFA